MSGSLSAHNICYFTPKFFVYLDVWFTLNVINFLKLVAWQKDLDKHGMADPDQTDSEDAI